MIPKLFISLDELSSKEDETWKAAEALAQSGLPFGFKVSLDYLLSAGISTVAKRIHGLGRELFADLKMWNGTRTMTAVLQTLERLSVEVVTVHAVGDSELKKALDALGPRNIKVLATTILSNYDDTYCRRNFCRNRAEAVLHFAETAHKAGANGVVISGAYLSYVKHIPLLLCVPGLRFRVSVWDGHHSGETTPEAAKLAGADIVVCGSPIMTTADPVATTRKFLLALGTKLEA